MPSLVEQVCIWVHHPVVGGALYVDSKVWHLSRVDLDFCLHRVLWYFEQRPHGLASDEGAVALAHHHHSLVVLHGDGFDMV